MIVDKLKPYFDHQRIIFYYKEALQLLEDEREREDLQFTIANIYLKIKDRKNAKKGFSTLHKKGNRPIHFEASYLLGEIYIEEQNYPKAIKVLKSVSTISKSSNWYFDINYRLAEIFHFQERWEKARHYYRIAARAPRSFSKQKEAADNLNQISEYLKSLKNSETKQ